MTAKKSAKRLNKDKVQIGELTPVTHLSRPTNFQRRSDVKVGYRSFALVFALAILGAFFAAPAALH
jgi:hypothetical protein